MIPPNPPPPSPRHSAFPAGWEINFSEFRTIFGGLPSVISLLFGSQLGDIVKLAKHCGGWFIKGCGGEWRVLGSSFSVLYGKGENWKGKSLAAAAAAAANSN